MILLDAGNTEIKCHVYQRRLTRAGSLPSDMVSKAGIKRLLHATKTDDPNLVLVSSVWGEDTNSLMDHIAQAGFAPLLARRDFGIPLETHYDVMENWGMDRHLQTYAAWRRQGGDVAVIGGGTALTVDLVRAGKHRGGLIAPGWPLLQVAMSQGTRQLPEVEEYIPSFPARSTEANIQLGIQYAMEGTIEKVLKDVGDTPVIFTGGLGKRFSRKFHHPYQGDLVAQGLCWAYRASL